MARVHPDYPIKARCPVCDGEEGHRLGCDYGLDHEPVSPDPLLQQIEELADEFDRCAIKRHAYADRQPETRNRVALANQAIGDTFRSCARDLRDLASQERER